MKKYKVPIPTVKEFFQWISRVFSIKHIIKRDLIGNFILNRCYNTDCRIGLRNLPDNSVDCIITDVPFAIKHGKKDTGNYNRDPDNVMEGYVEIPIEEYEDFMTEWITLAKPKLTKKGLVIIVSSWSNQREVLNAIHTNGLYIINEIVWKYNFGLFTKKKMVSSHYDIFICSKVKDGSVFNKLYWYPEDVIQSQDFDLEILDIRREYWTGLDKTPNKLPKELVEMLIYQYTNVDQIILDCFSGCGTILKVASQLGRYCLAFEIVKKYTDFSNYRLNELDY